MSRYSDLLKKINQKSANVCVVGLGYIGLPTALYYASRGLIVHGLDTNEVIIDELREGIIRARERGLVELAENYLSKINLETSYSEVESAEVYVLCLPSPIDKNKRVVTRYLEDSVTKLSETLRKGALILVESTVPVGTTERLAELFGEKGGLKLDKDYWFAHSPERVLPGKVLDELGTNHRLVGGVSERSTELATAFLSSVFEPNNVHPTTARIAEAAKLAENAYRDVNVAYANELARICSVVGIDVNEVIKLANLHPRVKILQPGIGVGGYCLPKDGWLLVESVRDGSFEPRVIPAAREINDSMPAHVFDRIRQINHEILSLKRVVGVLGLSFKPNISDTRNSPSVELIRLLIDAGIDVVVYDPYVDRDFGARRAESLDDLLNICEVVVIGAGHDVIIEQLRESDLDEKVVIDPNNVIPDIQGRVKLYLGISN